MTKNRSNKKKNKQVGGKLVVHPPMFRSNPSFPLKLRFTASGNVGSSASPIGITALLLCQACGLIETGATTAYPVAQAVRVKRVSVWCPYIGLGAPGIAGILFPGAGSGFGSNTEVNSVSLSTSEPAYVTASPPPQSDNAFWTTGNGIVLFSIYGSLSGTTTGDVIVDVDLEYVQMDGNAGALVTIAGGIQGVISFPPLDGYAAGVFFPVGRTRT